MISWYQHTHSPNVNADDDVGTPQGVFPWGRTSRWAISTHTPSCGLQAPVRNARLIHSTSHLPCTGERSRQAYTSRQCRAHVRITHLEVCRENKTRQATPSSHATIIYAHPRTLTPRTNTAYLGAHAILAPATLLRSTSASAKEHSRRQSGTASFVG